MSQNSREAGLIADFSTQNLPCFFCAYLLKWKKEGLGGIYEKKGRGRSKKWQEEDMQYLEWKLRNEPRRYNSKQLSEVLAKGRGITLSSDRLRRILKKRG